MPSPGFDDEDADLAVVQLVDEQLSALGLGDSDALQPGVPIAVIGSPVGFEGTLHLAVSLAIFLVLSLPLSWRYVRRLRRSKFTWQPEPEVSGSQTRRIPQRRSGPRRER
jgi:hypothetical protein